MEETLDNVTIVLVRPKYPENIGAAARIARNMGVSRISVVSTAFLDAERITRMATHHASEIVRSMDIFPSVGEALASCSYVVATTARHGRRRRVTTTPRDLPSHILPLLAENRVAIVFGPEDKGLANDDLKAANLLVTIPSTGYSSLNLAQAVAILCYELYYGALLYKGKARACPPRLAEVRELEGMYAHIEEVLRGIGFLKDEDHEYWMGKVRNFLGRVGLRSSEARMVRGMCRQALWYDGKKKKE